MYNVKNPIVKKNEIPENASEFEQMIFDSVECLMQGEPAYVFTDEQATAILDYFKDGKDFTVVKTADCIGILPLNTSAKYRNEFYAVMSE